MKKLYTPDVEQLLQAVGIIGGFYALMAIAAYFA
jgi:hypothetical protein